MPELPEVEVICSYLRRVLPGKKLTHVDILLARMLRNKTPDEASALLTGNVISDVQRRGKYIEIRFEDGLLMLIHLRMTGRLVYHEKAEENTDRHTRFIFYFTDKSVLVFGDTRTFGSLDLFAAHEPVTIASYHSLGVEPLSPQFTAKYCYNLCSGSHAPLKSFLLNQKYIAGLGNIYADEALFLSKLSPLRKACTVTPEEAKRLHRAVRKVLRDSLSRGGTTFRDYRNGQGEQGENQKHLFVYSRRGLPCLKCGSTLRHKIMGGRQTVYCEKCQH